MFIRALACLMTAIAPLTLDTGSLAVVKRVEALIGSHTAVDVPYCALAAGSRRAKRAQGTYSAHFTAHFTNSKAKTCHGIGYPGGQGRSNMLCTTAGRDAHK